MNKPHQIALAGSVGMGKLQKQNRGKSGAVQKMVDPKTVGRRQWGCPNKPQAKQT